MGATGLAGGLVRDDQMTEQQAVWGDQAGSEGSWVNQARRGGQLGATRPAGRAVRGDLDGGVGGQLG